MTAVIVASRRDVAPFGLPGGGDGDGGRQWVKRADRSASVMAGRASTLMQAGDCFVIEAPGGGGFGVPSRTPKAEL